MRCHRLVKRDFSGNSILVRFEKMPVWLSSDSTGFVNQRRNPTVGAIPSTGSSSDYHYTRLQVTVSM